MLCQPRQGRETSPVTWLIGSMPTPILAHQGGWDEFLMVAAPLLLLAVVLRGAKRRADRLTQTTTPPPDPGPEDGAPGEVSPGAPPTPPAP